MKVFVLLLAVLGTTLAAKLDKTPYLDKTPNGLAALLAEKGGIEVGEIGTRIVGGVTTPIEQVPYIVSMQRNNAHRCGGAIISPTRILTAAHCLFATFFPIPATELSVRAGSSNSASGGQVIQVLRYVNHPQYSHITLNNDIAVMHLVSALDLSPAGVATIGMPAQNAGVAAGTLARVSGWGALSEGGAGSITLQAVSVPVVTNAECNASYGGGITNGMLCAGFPEGGRDACQGDSGGPLSAGNQVIGIVSWGRGCARPGFPGVYARVAFYRSWIDEN
ncbi:trypsin-3-like [Bradysia coprophila]|uniref:trypsin-3-like n=1 Tax=Bradysia coprophila TaxID=38358 RepID=UPI00187D7178|nr:trypsin-3-like [Bradysia coprophila]